MYIHTAFIHKKVVKKFWKIEREKKTINIIEKSNIIVEKTIDIIEKKHREKVRKKLCFPYIVEKFLNYYNRLWILR